MRDLSFSSERHQRDFKLLQRAYRMWQIELEKTFAIEKAAINLTKRTKRLVSIKPKRTR